MGLPCRLSIVLYAFLLRSTLCMAECENGLVTDSLILQDYSEDDCLNQTDPKHCFNSIGSGGGLCYLAREEAVTHKGEDCVYHLPIIYESEKINIAEDYLNQTFSGPLETNGTFPESAFKHCQSINCYMVLHEEATNRAYFMVEPSKLSLSESGISFGANDQHYTMYFEPRCEPTKPIGRTNVPEECAKRYFPSSPPPNAKYAIEEQTYVDTTSSNAAACKVICDLDSLCTGFEFTVYLSSCRLFKEAADSISSSECVLEPLAPRVFVKDVFVFEPEDGQQLLDGYTVAIQTGNTDDCWNDCTKDPVCQTASLYEGMCALINSAWSESQSLLPQGGKAFMVWTGRVFADETACDLGRVTDHMMEFVDDPEKCEENGLCHRVIKIGGNASPFCYAPNDLEPLETDDGEIVTPYFQMQTAHNLDTLSDLFQSSIRGRIYPQDCLRNCVALSCFAYAYAVPAQSTDSLNVCTFALEPFDLASLPPTSSDGDNTQTLITFARHGVPLDELCQDEGPLPANWHFASAVYNPFETVDASSIDECKEICNPNGDCNDTLIFRPEDSTCRIFETKEIFEANSETASTTRSSNSRHQCIVTPSEGGKFRPRAFFTVNSAVTNQISVEPRERVVFLEKVNSPSDGNNVCWDFCSKLPWCREVHLVGDDQCLLYDGSEGNNTLRNATEGEELQLRHIMRGKMYTHEHICDEGGLVDAKFFFSQFSQQYCDFFSLCYRRTRMGEAWKDFCFFAPEVPPEPIQVTHNCQVQPFFTSLPGLEIDYGLIRRSVISRPEGNQSYEACAQVCSLDEDCYGLTYFPSIQECAIHDRPLLFESNQEPINVLECRMAFEVPHCQPCVERVQMEEHIVFKDELQCSHTYQESCSDVYKTIFKTQEVEECKESFVKNCHIEYEMVPRSEKVEVCLSPLARDCNEEGPETCSTEHETVCATTYHENEVADDVVNCTTVQEEVCDPEGENCRMVPRQVCQVESISNKKLTPETDCHQESREVCGPEICPIVQGDRICTDELKTFVQEVPQEKCQISPKTVCNMIHKIVPKLEMSQECIEVPQEVCETVQVEAMKERFPVVKYFCPPAESDSPDDDDDDDDDNTIADSPSSQSGGTRSASEDDMSPMESQSTHLLDHIATTRRGSRRNSKSGR